MPKVSILVPIYNVEMYLNTCLDTIINQTLKEIEIILINDGSTDNCPQICDDYAAKDKRIKVIHKKNSGYGATMNVGLNACAGEYIGIVEPDDYVALDMYETLYDKAKEFDLDFIKADFNRFTGEDKNLQLTYNKIAKADKNYNKVVNPSENPDMLQYIMNTWSGIYKRDFLLHNNITHSETPGASFQDNGFWFKTFCLAKRAYFLDRPFYMNRRDNPNSSVKNPEKVYCVNAEYRLIKEWLNERPAIKEKFIFMYTLKKYHNYMFTLNRIDDKFKEQYIADISKELAEDLKNREIDKKTFGKQYGEVMLLINNPRQFFVKLNNAPCQKKTYYLFNFIPVLKTKTQNNTTKYYLFGIPLFKH